MPFSRTQSILSEVLPKRGYRLLYRFACSAYGVWQKIYVAWQKMLEELCLSTHYIYYLLTLDSKNVKKIKTIYSIRPYTMVGRTGLMTTYDIADEIEKNNLSGCFLECGVARGGCSACMALVSATYQSKRKIWLFDTFEGLPDPTIEDMHDASENPGKKNRSDSVLYRGYCLGTYQEVSKVLFSKLDLSREDIFMVKGLVQDTLPNYKDKIGKISFLRIDVDWYESTNCCLENLYDNVINGGYIYIDDYHLLGCKKAVEEFMAKKKSWT